MNPSHDRSQFVLAAARHAALIAAIDRIVPKDDFPSASQAGVGGFLLGLLAGDAAREAALIAEGLDALNRAAGGDFASLDVSAQDAILAAFESHADPGLRRFFARLVEMTQEGYYANPENGGNRRAASWKMIGYEPRVPGYRPEEIE